MIVSETHAFSSTCADDPQQEQDNFKKLNEKLDQILVEGEKKLEEKKIAKISVDTKDQAFEFLLSNDEEKANQAGEYIFKNLNPLYGDEVINFLEKNQAMLSSDISIDILYRLNSFSITFPQRKKEWKNLKKAEELAFSILEKGDLKKQTQLYFELNLIKLNQFLKKNINHLKDVQGSSEMREKSARILVSFSKSMGMRPSARVPDFLLKDLEQTFNDLLFDTNENLSNAAVSTLNEIATYRSFKNILKAAQDGKDLNGALDRILYSINRAENSGNEANVRSFLKVDADQMPFLISLFKESPFSKKTELVTAAFHENLTLTLPFLDELFEVIKTCEDDLRKPNRVSSVSHLINLLNDEDLSIRMLQEIQIIQNLNQMNRKLYTVLRNVGVNGLRNKPKLIDELFKVLFNSNTEDVCAEEILNSFDSSLDSTYLSKLKELFQVVRVGNDQSYIFKLSNLILKLENGDKIDALRKIFKLNKLRALNMQDLMARYCPYSASTCLNLFMELMDDPDYPRRSKNDIAMSLVDPLTSFRMPKDGVHRMLNKFFDEQLERAKDLNEEDIRVLISILNRFIEESGSFIKSKDYFERIKKSENIFLLSSVVKSCLLSPFLLSDKYAFDFIISTFEMPGMKENLDPLTINWSLYVLASGKSELKLSKSRIRKIENIFLDNLTNAAFRDPSKFRGFLFSFNFLNNFPRLSSRRAAAHIIDHHFITGVPPELTENKIYILTQSFLSLEKEAEMDNEGSKLVAKYRASIYRDQGQGIEPLPNLTEGLKSRNESFKKFAEFLFLYRASDVVADQAIKDLRRNLKIEDLSKDDFNHLLDLITERNGISSEGIKFVQELANSKILDAGAKSKILGAIKSNWFETSQDLWPMILKMNVDIEFQKDRAAAVDYLLGQSSYEKILELVNSSDAQVSNEILSVVSRKPGDGSSYFDELTSEQKQTLLKSVRHLYHGEDGEHGIWAETRSPRAEALGFFLLSVSDSKGLVADENSENLLLSKDQLKKELENLETSKSPRKAEWLKKIQEAKAPHQAEILAMAFNCFEYLEISAESKR
ncbi:MAG: hypothetical protein J0L93_02315 [Deltaproteobacteria bacterium]|nr:hypothetical protein [Deltaproteobacteria bacterium]